MHSPPALILDPTASDCCRCQVSILLLLLPSYYYDVLIFRACRISSIGPSRSVRAPIYLYTNACQWHLNVVKHHSLLHPPPVLSLSQGLCLSCQQAGLHHGLSRLCGGPVPPPRPSAVGLALQRRGAQTSRQALVGLAVARSGIGEWQEGETCFWQGGNEQDRGCARLCMCVS